MGNWILVVDDDTSNLRMASRILSEEKMRVSCLKSGEGALQFLQENRPDLILLDIHMPGMDGFETIAAIKGDEAIADIPVIFLTADDDSNAKMRGLEVGAVDFIKKPFMAEELLRSIRRAMDFKYGIETEKGLSLAKGDMELYLDIIDMFLKDRKRQGTMRQFIEEENMKDYAVLVHGLKGNARMLGAEKLADLAYEHEMKSKAGDMAYVKTHWEELLALWNHALEGLREFYSEYRAEGTEKYTMADNQGGRVLQLSQSDLAEVVVLLDNFEREKAIEKLKTWISSPLEQHIHKRIKDALIALEDEYDEDKAIALLKDEWR